MISLFVKMPKPSLVQDKSPQAVRATLQIENDQGNVRYSDTVLCDLVADDNDQWKLVGTMQPRCSSDQEMVANLTVDRIIARDYGLGGNVGEDFDQKYTR